MPCEKVSAETATAKDLEVLHAGTAAIAGAVASAPESEPQPAPEIVAENLVGEKVGEDGAQDEDGNEDEETASASVITCKTKISLVHTVEGKPIIVDQSSTVMFPGPMPVKDAFERAIKLAEKDLDPEKVVEVSFTCEFP